MMIDFRNENIMDKRIKCVSEDFYDLCVSYLQNWSKGARFYVHRWVIGNKDGNAEWNQIMKCLKHRAGS